MTTSIDDRAVDETDSPVEVTETGCVVVGGGPAGAMLALLLARAGVEVVLLEAHADFDRQFRGDTVHPSTLEILDAIGLGERVHRLPHTRVPAIPLETPDGPAMVGDLRYLRSPFRYIMLVHQARFLEFLTDEAARFPCFQLIMRANVRRLVHDQGRVTGVRYRQSDGWHEVRAAVVVAADGRHSKMRGLAGVDITRRDASIDSLWFTLPLLPGQPDRSFARVNRAGLSGVMLRRDDHWQVALNIPKGSFPEVKTAGIEQLRNNVVDVLPELTESVSALQDWKQTSLLSIWMGRLRRWHRDGLLFIGDAAHVMTPAFGFGINLAIQDAVVAADVLVLALRKHARTGTPVPQRTLGSVQRRRGLPTAAIQSIQRGMDGRQSRASADGPPQMSHSLRRLMNAPVARHLLAHLLGVGIWRVHVRSR